MQLMDRARVVYLDDASVSDVARFQDHELSITIAIFTFSTSSVRMDSADAIYCIALGWMIRGLADLPAPRRAP